MAGTNNSWNNQIAGSYNQIILNAGTNGVAISTDASAATVNIATGGAVKTSTFGSTNSTSSTTVQSGSGALALTSTNGTWTGNSGTGNLGLSTDASATTVSLATGGAIKTVTLGSTNSSSTTTIACGTGGCNVGTSANAHATIVGSTTASATTIIQAPSGGVTLTGVQGFAVSNKNYVTINTATGVIGSDAGPSSSITITGDTGGGLTGSSFTFTGGTTGLTFAGAGSTETLGGTLAIANGGTNATSMSTSNGIVKYDGTRLVTSSTAQIDSSNRMTNTSQPAFSAYVASVDSNVTGNGAIYTVGTNTAYTKIFDQGTNFNTNGTFTAPVTGRYFLSAFVRFSNCTIATTFFMFLTTTSRYYITIFQRAASSNDYEIAVVTLADMTASDTAYVRVQVNGEAGNTVAVSGAATNPQVAFSGYLVC